MKSPAFQFYIRDWILSRSVSKMTGDEVKAYLYLLCESWLEEPRATLPNDDEELSKMSQLSLEKWSKVKPRVMANFNLIDERWVNLKLLGVSQNQSKFKEWGKMGGNPNLTKNHKSEPKRVNPHVNGKVNPSHIPLVNLASSTATATATVSETESKRRVVAKAPPGFEEFWKSYPNKKAKGDALKAWIKVSPPSELQGEILCAVARQKTMDAWTREEGKYIPHPATWLNGSRWLDEVAEKKPDLFKNFVPHFKTQQHENNI